MVVFGCGLAGQFASAVDCIASRLDAARSQGAEAIDFNQEDPVATIHSLTGGIGVDRAIDAVGVDVMGAHSGLAADRRSEREIQQREEEVREIAPDANPSGGNWIPGDAPSQVLEWAVRALAKAGTLSIVGVYPETAKRFPIGMAITKNLIIKAGNCNHRRYIPMLVEMVRAGVFDPTRILTQTGPLTGALDAYRKFDERQPGWLKVELLPAA